MPSTMDLHYGAGLSVRNFGEGIVEISIQEVRKMIAAPQGTHPPELLRTLAIEVGNAGHNWLGTQLWALAKAHELNHRLAAANPGRVKIRLMGF